MRLLTVAACIGSLCLPVAAQADPSPEPLPATTVTFGLGALHFDPQYDEPPVTAFVALEVAHNFASRFAGLVEVGSPLLLFIYPVFPHLLLGGRIHLFAPVRGSLTPFVDVAAGYEYTHLCPYECAPPKAFAWLARAGTGLEYITREGTLFRLALGRGFGELNDPTWFAGLAFGYR